MSSPTEAPVTEAERLLNKLAGYQTLNNMAARNDVIEAFDRISAAATAKALEDAIGIYRKTYGIPGSLFEQKCWALINPMREG